MAHFTRREFIKTGLAAGTLAVSGAIPLGARRGSATDVVTLGRSGVKVTRLAFGTGSFSGRVQRSPPLPGPLPRSGGEGTKQGKQSE